MRIINNRQLFETASDPCDKHLIPWRRCYPGDGDRNQAHCTSLPYSNLCFFAAALVDVIFKYVDRAVEVSFVSTESVFTVVKRTISIIEGIILHIEGFLVPDFPKALMYCHTESSANLCIVDLTESRADTFAFLLGLGANSIRIFKRLCLFFLEFSHPSENCFSHSRSCWKT